MHILFNTFAASSGSGLTYVRNVAAALARRSDFRATFLVGPELAREFRTSPNVAFEQVHEPQSAVRRAFWEQSRLPQILRKRGADVLVSAGNIALRRSPVPQILLSGNSLYTSGDYRRDLLHRREYRLWTDNASRSFFAARSIHWADVTIAPSEAFAQDLRDWTGSRRIQAIHHGFDREVFFNAKVPVPESMQKAFNETEGCLRLLFVSHFNYFRNFETLFRGLSLLRAMLPEKNAKLLLTTRLRSAENPGDFRAESAAALVRELGLSEHVIELGAVPYAQLQHLYRACDVYVTASYAETFAHPVVEAMASGVPVVASGLAVHQEVARDAAIYFPRFSAEEFARQVQKVVNAPELGCGMARNGEARARDFSWEKHVDELLGVARNLLEGRAQRPD
jgi:glycosyltransferase involved in cell wall biosynthesis